jgi:hypothetical protein
MLSLIKSQILVPCDTGGQKIQLFGYILLGSLLIFFLTGPTRQYPDEAAAVVETLCGLSNAKDLQSCNSNHCFVRADFLLFKRYHGPSQK